MITAIAAMTLLNPAQVAEQTTVPQAPAPVVQSYDWNSQKGHGSINSGTAYQTGSIGALREDWQAD